MKIVKNKKTNLKLEVDSGFFALYSNLILVCIDKAIPKELTFIEMKNELNLIQKLDSAKVDEDIELSDEQYQKIKTSIQSFKWPAIHTDIISFCEDILNA